jgi:hypothetical protein
LWNFRHPGLGADATRDNKGAEGVKRLGPG